MKTSETITEISKALIKVQMKVVDVFPDKKGYGYSYADLPQVLNVLRPLVTDNGMCILQGVDDAGGDGIIISTRILHESGEWIESSYQLPPTTLKGANEVQALGSSITYGRRYHLASMFGIATDKDLDGRLDGDRENGSKPAQSCQSKQSPAKQKKSDSSASEKPEKEVVDIRSTKEFADMIESLELAKAAECVDDGTIKFCENVKDTSTAIKAKTRIDELIKEKEGEKNIPY